MKIVMDEEHLANWELLYWQSYLAEWDTALATLCILDYSQFEGKSKKAYKCLKLFRL